MEGTVEQGVGENTPQETTRPAKKRGGAAKRAVQSREQHAIEVQNNPRSKVEISLQSLLEAGAHFGHQTSRWNPTMAPYIYTARNGIHIINLPKTVQAWQEAREAIAQTITRGGNILFVGTKKQAQDAVVAEAIRSGAFYVSRRWLGGMLTNFQTIRKSIERLNKIETILAEEENLLATSQTPKFTKKERLMMSREREKLEFSLGGIRDMHGAPELIFVIDIRREEIAISEAARLNIPVVALVDTNCNPRSVTYPIPSNDDGTRAIRLFCAAVADTVIEARKSAPVRKPRKQEVAPVVSQPEAAVASAEVVEAVAAEAVE